MDDSSTTTGSTWNSSTSAKTRNAAQRCVTALLDELAPERVLRRAESFKGPVDQHRTPSGCVLQASDCAVSVSWFAEPNAETIGELRITVWRGTVARRGVSRPRENATVVSEESLRPAEAGADECVWEGGNGQRFTTATLAARCLALLEEQVTRSA